MIPLNIAALCCVASAKGMFAGLMVCPAGLALVLTTGLAFAQPRKPFQLTAPQASVQLIAWFSMAAYALASLDDYDAYDSCDNSACVARMRLETRSSSHLTDLIGWGPGRMQLSHILESVSLYAAAFALAALMLLLLFGLRKKERHG
ncbi:hypothetical protein HMPREF9336_01849 [Segniliparus rugosus ATCC BAA-974]|uniref:Uncharacterized protein n=2 Tax=Segniliparus rugosus TaxID=286804 RepID=E5XQS7_SEGRC|nr:hypothetical protein HMPREF9336_01849 [Segniliparus rugosus ATCC BAA-974]